MRGGYRQTDAIYKPDGRWNKPDFHLFYKTPENDFSKRNSKRI